MEDAQTHAEVESPGNTLAFVGKILSEWSEPVI